jgi:hypothetical protein
MIYLGDNNNLTLREKRKLSKDVTVLCKGYNIEYLFYQKKKD